ncbi:hypothetical protein FRC11_005955 [Ceratobasidium sp. 423]|nr:hypothetical protein FRC11_005955 [Ceratobasidium sp. 423]
MHEQPPKPSSGWFNNPSEREIVSAAAIYPPAMIVFRPHQCLVFCTRVSRALTHSRTRGLQVLSIRQSPGDDTGDLLRLLEDSGLVAEESLRQGDDFLGLPPMEPHTSNASALPLSLANDFWERFNYDMEHAMIISRGTSIIEVVKEDITSVGGNHSNFATGLFHVANKFQEPVHQSLADEWDSLYPSLKDILPHTKRVFVTPTV